MSSDWVAFWDSPHSIYVNVRHRDVHYRLIARDIAALVPSREARVLDYGSGEALSADLVAAAAGKVFLCDAAPGVRSKLEARFGANAKISIVTPGDVALLPDGSLDLIVLHSVVQYLSAAETDALFALFRRLLKPEGLFVVSDVVAPHVPAAVDAWALVRFGAANGFLFAAFRGLVRSLLTDYRRLRSRLGLMRHSDAAMIEKLAAAGFAARRAPTNLGHNQARAAFWARPR